MFEYQLLPTPTATKKVKGVKTIEGRFAHAMADALNEQAKSGWEFVGQESFAVEEKAGMMSKAKGVTLNYLVFRRAVAQDAVPLDMKLKNMRARKAATIVQPAPEPAAEPFPEPMPSPQAMGESFAAPTGGEEPTKVFEPLHSREETGDAPSLGPASKD